MNFVPRKPTTSKNKHSVKDFAKVKKEFLQEVVITVEMENIPPELILNWDQNGIKIVPTKTWTMNRRGSKRVSCQNQCNCCFLWHSTRIFPSSTAHLCGEDCILSP